MINVAMKMKMLERGFKSYKVAKEINMHPVRYSQILNNAYPATKDERKKIVKALGTTEKALFPETVGTDHE